MLTRTYGPYGELNPTGPQLTLPPGASAYPYLYTGQRYDAYLAAYDYKARIYDPKDGRFWQPDPIGTTDDINLYSYTHNSPLDGTDPGGQEEIALFRTIAGTVKHEAIIIGNDKTGWTYMSKDGSQDAPKGPLGAAHGPSTWEIDGYSTKAQALSDAKQNGYTDAFSHASNSAQDAAAKKTMNDAIKSTYDVRSANCGQASAASERAAGIPTYSGNDPNPGAAQNWMADPKQGGAAGWKTQPLPSITPVPPPTNQTRIPN